MLSCFSLVFVTDFIKPIFFSEYYAYLLLSFFCVVAHTVRYKLVKIVITMYYLYFDTWRIETHIIYLGHSIDKDSTHLSLHLRAINFSSDIYNLWLNPIYQTSATNIEQNRIWIVYVVASTMEFIYRFPILFVLCSYVDSIRQFGYTIEKKSRLFRLKKWKIEIRKLNDILLLKLNVIPREWTKKNQQKIPI